MRVFYPKLRHTAVRAADCARSTSTDLFSISLDEDAPLNAARSSSPVWMALHELSGGLRAAVKAACVAKQMTPVAGVWLPVADSGTETFSRYFINTTSFKLAGAKRDFWIREVPFKKEQAFDKAGNPLWFEDGTPAIVSRPDWSRPGYDSHYQATCADVAAALVERIETTTDSKGAEQSSKVVFRSGPLELQYEPFRPDSVGDAFVRFARDRK